MKLWAVVCTYVADAVTRRAPYRDAHLTRARELQAAGHLVAAGAFADPVDGALLVFRAASKAEVEAWLAEDPYVLAGLWPTITIREWTVVVGSV